MHDRRYAFTLLHFPFQSRVNQILPLQARNSRLDALEADNYMEETGERGDDAAYVDSEVHTHIHPSLLKPCQVNSGWKRC